MKAKEYLEQINYLKMLLELKLEELKEQRATIEGIGGMQISERVQTSPSNNSMDNTIIKLEKVCKEIENTVDQLLQKRKNTISTIEKVKDINKNYYEVLFRRYVLDQKWEVIAVNMKYDTRWVQRLHGRALQEIDKIRNKP